MKHRSLTLVMAAAVLSLQACDVEVHDRPQAAAASESTATTPQTSTNVAAGTPQQGDSAVPAAPAASAAPDSMAAASATTEGLDAAPPPAQTSAMGAPAAGTPSGAAAPMDAGTTPEGVAAPTELGRFLQENPIGGSKSAQDRSANPDGARAGAPSAATRS